MNNEQLVMNNFFVLRNLSLIFKCLIEELGKNEVLDK
jgi:hypothetical protein